MDRLIEVRNLKMHFITSSGVMRAVDGVDLYINKGETLCVVGESGCGKSVTCLSIMRLIPTPPGKYVAGEILFEGEDLLTKPKHEMRRIRGKDIAMIFQEPMTSLIPVYTIGAQIAEAIQLHQGLSRRASMAKAEEMLHLIGVPDPHRRVDDYPHQMSGGMRQRAMLAMALCCNPKLLIADEPTTALDVTIQAQILQLMRNLKDELGMAIMLVTHDLGVAAEMAERVVVMYCGTVVEEAAVGDLFHEPLHPYTEGLLACIPRLDKDQKKLRVIEGAVPDLAELPNGCRFHPRCHYARDVCQRESSPLVQIGDRRVACRFPRSERRRTGEVT